MSQKDVAESSPGVPSTAGKRSVGDKLPIRLLAILQGHRTFAWYSASPKLSAASAAGKYGPDVAVARVEVCWSSTDEERQAIGRSLHAALVEALRVPADDPTVIVIDRAHDTLVAPSKVSDRYTIVSITLFLGRTLATKERLYASIVEHLSGCGIPARGVLIVLDEVPVENWGVDGGVPASKTDVGFRIDV